MIEFRNVKKIYTGGINTIALDEINFVIEKEEFVSLVGHSGAGKSTLLKLLYAEEKPTSGEIFFNGEDISNLTPKQLPFYRRRIGTVFQDFKLLPRKTLFENVAFALEVSDHSDKEINELVPQILEIVGLAHKLDSYPREISGGEQQRVAIARALVHRPPLIIADEPTGNLDPISSWGIIQLLLKINKLGTTILLATHNKDIVNRVKKRVITLDQGKIIRDHSKGRYAI
ncbi:MAG TPA: cell division ATP-binding protein FtsE [Candidatus Saccharimonadales bacterium]|jgi:cell division transport system ATP-binding protein|nr:cell division ATP-binding protein FtsE [Candidatus Saccharimonadales bacterium]